MKVAIIGGGIIGLSSAYYLNKAGYEVTIFDSGNMLDNCSIGNAGMIVPSHIVPLAAPGMISKGIRWMFNSRSPFYVKPRLSGSLVKWGYCFYKHANQNHVEYAIPALKSISLFSQAKYEQMVLDSPFNFGYQRRGLLMLYQTKVTEREEVEAAGMANRNGIEAIILSPDEVQKLEPDVRVTVRGGVYFPKDAYLVPQHLVKNLTQYLKNEGIVILTHTPVTDFLRQGNSVKGIVALGEKLDFDEYILTAGAWSGILSSTLGLDIPMQGGKGYSFTVDDVQRNVRVPSILLEGRVAVTPMGSSLRFGGTMEINGTDRSINMNRVKGIVDTIPAYYPEMNVAVPNKGEIWSGLRPCSPDGLPYIGRSTRFTNLVIATGHSMLGVSLAAGTGKLVEQIIGKEKPDIDLAAFNPERFA